MIKRGEFMRTQVPARSLALFSSGFHCRCRTLSAVSCCHMFQFLYISLEACSSTCRWSIHGKFPPDLHPLFCWKVGTARALAYRSIEEEETCSNLQERNTTTLKPLDNILVKRQLSYPLKGNVLT